MTKPRNIVLNQAANYQSGPRIGVWDGEVVSIDDPTKSGRVRIRIFLLHGDEQTTPDAALPWAEVSYWGGGHDWGEFDPPPVGTKVHLMFKMGKEAFPIVIGCARGKPIQAQTMRAKKSNDSEPQWITPEKVLETPKDVFEGKDEGEVHPTLRTWRKSFKGHTIMVEEADEYEFLKIVDRAGQVIEMNCPVTQEVNATLDAGQRGVRDSTKDTQFEHSEMVEARGFIRVKDLSGQELVLDGRAGNEKIYLHNRNRTGSRSQLLEMSNKKGEEYIQLLDQAGNKMRIADNDEISLLLEDKKGSQLGIDGKNGNIVLNPKNGIVESLGKDRISTTQGNDEKTIEGNRIVKVLNSLAVSAGGDAGLSAVGGARASIGGALSLLVANLPLSGVPNLEAIKALIATGGFCVQTIDPALGTIKILNTVDPTGATISVGGLVVQPPGNTLLSGMVLVQIGKSQASAIHPVARGDMQELFNAAHIHPTGTGPSGPATPGVPPLPFTVMSPTILID